MNNEWFWQLDEVGRHMCREFLIIHNVTSDLSEKRIRCTICAVVCNA